MESCMVLIIFHSVTFHVPTTGNTFGLDTSDRISDITKSLDTKCDIIHIPTSRVYSRYSYTPVHTGCSKLTYGVITHIRIMLINLQAC